MENHPQCIRRPGFQTGAGFETERGSFFVETVFAESAIERIRQEQASGRKFLEAAVFEDGKILKIVGYEDGLSS